MRKEVELIVDVSTVASFFDVDERTVQKWAAEGMPKLGRGEYDLIQCARWKINEMAKEIDELSKGDLTLYAMKKTNMQITTEKRMIEIMELKKELMPVDYVVTSLMSIMKVVGDRIGKIPNLIPSLLHGEVDETIVLKIQKKISDKCNDIRNELAETKIDIPKEYGDIE